MTELRGLTLWQPMAWAISDIPEPDAKRIENRPWKPWRGVTHVAIHAGAKFYRPHAEQIEDVFGISVPSKKELPSGAFVAVARLAGCLEQSDDPWFSGPFGWLLADVVKLPEPIPSKGALGLWRIQPPILRRIERTYRAEIQNRMDRADLESAAGMQPQIPRL